MLESLPSTTTQEGTRWLIAPGTIRTPDTHIEEHDILPPDETTIEDAPAYHSDAVHEFDLEALEAGQLRGKWLLPSTKDRVDAEWKHIRELIDDNVLHFAKVSTAWQEAQRADGDSHIFIIYTPNYFDTDDVYRVRDALRHKLYATQDLSYKPDYYTACGVYPNTIDEFDLPSSARFTY